MKKLVQILLGNPIINSIMSLLTYAFYGAVIGLSLTPSALFLYQMSKILPFENMLNVFLFALCVGVSVYMFFIVSLIVFGIIERILTFGFKPGKYGIDSPTFTRWIIYSGLHVFLLHMVLPYVAGTVWAKMFYKILGAKIGKNSFINTAGLHDAYLLEVGDDVVIGGNTNVSCHIFEGEQLILGKIKIGNNSLISSDAYIMPGATIGEYCNIGIKGIVRKNKKIEDRSILMGFPATPIKKLAEILSDKDKE
jgi:carbonic anhydrase/acetyltransferase-like protein (isoleucine patch superfamily)